MAKEEPIQFEGSIVEVLGKMRFRVKLETSHVILAHVSGKMRKNRIRLLPGDLVIVEMSPYDLEKGRIVYRKRSEEDVPTPEGGAAPAATPPA